MRVQILCTPAETDFVTQAVLGWQERFCTDVLNTQVVELDSVGSLVSDPALGGGLVIGKVRHLRLESEADLYLVVTAEVTDAPATQNLANLVVSRVRREGRLQPVIALAGDTPLSRRQLTDTGLSGVYLRSEHPQRTGAVWGRILAQTWHIPARETRGDN